MDRAQSGIRFNKAFGDTVNWDLIPTDAAGAVVAGRPEQRPLLVVAVASRLEVVVDAPPTPPTEPSAGVERWIGSIKLYRLWLKRRSSCLSPSLGAYGL